MKKLLILALAALSLAACETVSYYGQAVTGQLYILSHRKEIESLIRDQRTEPELREKLGTILEIRGFAEAELGLPVKDSYSTYVDVERPYVVWNVFATPEFSMQPLRWCYPIAGCVSYRGYFSRASASDFADDLRDRDYDVYTGGVAAYSTLGWFSDPLLNTVIGREDHQLASLLFHELAHQLIYIPGDTEFNESFATAVEQEGLRRWLASRGNGRGGEIMDGVLTDMLRRQEFVTLVKQAVGRLKTLYAQDMPTERMREEKARILDGLRGDYEVFKRDWGGYTGYDAWFAQDLNNARLNTVATYHNWVPAFNRMLLEADGDLGRFYARVAALGKLDRRARRAYLEALLDDEPPRRQEFAEAESRATI